MLASQRGPNSFQVAALATVIVQAISYSNLFLISLLRVLPSSDIFTFGGGLDLGLSSFSIKFKKDPDR